MATSPELSKNTLPFSITIGTDTEPDPEIESFRAEIADALQHPDYPCALHTARTAHALFIATDNRRGRANALYIQGMVYRYLDNCEQAHNCLQASLEEWEALGDSEGMTRCLMERGGTCTHQMDFVGAMTYFQQCMSVCQQIGFRQREISALGNIACLHLEVGNCATALDLLQENLAYYEEAGDKPRIVWTLENIAEAYCLLDEHEEAIQAAQRGYAIWWEIEGVGCPASCPSHLLSTLGTAYRKAGQLKTARFCLEEAIAFSGQSGLPWMLARIWSDLGAVLHQQESYDRARDALDRSVSMNGRQGHLFTYAQALERLGILYATPDFPGYSETHALALLSEARQVVEESDSVPLLVPVYTALADLYERRGELKEAVSCLRLLNATERRLFNTESARRVKRLELERVQRNVEIARRDAEILHLRTVELAEALTEAECQRQRADQLAHTDALTGVMNRRALDERLGEEWRRATRHGRPLSLAVIDIDHFKSINDRYGHAVGDLTLARVAALLRSYSRPGDQIARYGGEEFVLLFPETPLPVAAVVCERLREILAGQNWADVHPNLSAVTVSIGVSTIEGEAIGTGKYPDVASLFTQADHNLYRAKRNGRNQVVGGEVIR